MCFYKDFISILQPDDTSYKTDAYCGHSEEKRKDKWDQTRNCPLKDFSLIIGSYRSSGKTQKVEQQLIRHNEKREWKPL